MTYSETMTTPPTTWLRDAGISGVADKLEQLGMRYAKDVYTGHMADIVNALNEAMGDPIAADVKVTEVFNRALDVRNDEDARQAITGYIRNLDPEFPNSPDSSAELAYFNDGFAKGVAEIKDFKVLHRRQWLCLGQDCGPLEDHLSGPTADLPEFLRG